MVALPHPSFLLSNKHKQILSKQDKGELQAHGGFLRSLKPRNIEEAPVPRQLRSSYLCWRHKIAAKTGIMWGDYSWNDKDELSPPFGWIQICNLRFQHWAQIQFNPRSGQNAVIGNFSPRHTHVHASHKSSPQPYKIRSILPNKGDRLTLWFLYWILCLIVVDMLYVVNNVTMSRRCRSTLPLGESVKQQDLIDTFYGVK